MLSCEETARLHATDEIRDGNLVARLRVKLHLMMCANCRRYASQLRALGRAARRASSHPQRDASSLRHLEESILESNRPD